MQIVSSRDTVRKEVPRDGHIGFRSEYIGSPGIIDANPQAFLVERMYPGALITPHFHDIDQFQIHSQKSQLSVVNKPLLVSIKNQV